MSKTFFVYGTLRRPHKGGMAEYLRKNATFIGEATVDGKIYYMGFPAYRPLFEGEEGEVIGDLYEVSDKVERQLDQYEGVPNLYVQGQTLATIITPDGEVPSTKRVNIYVYNRALDNYPLIEDGDYLNYCANK